MAFGTDHIVTTEIGNFIPELWSDEVVAAYKSNIVVRNLVRVLNHKGKKGDTIKLPTPTRGAASAKSQEALVTFIAHGTDNGVSVAIDKHYEYSRLIDDLADVQALESLRRFYTDDGGYAIAKRVDTDLILALVGGTLTHTASTNVIESTSTLPTTYEGDGTTWNEQGSTDISDAGIRAFIKLLDDNDVPFSNRVLLVPTIAKKDLLGTNRFTEQAFVGETGNGNTIRNGLIGDIYGMPVYVSTNLPTVDDSGGNADNKLGLMFHKDAGVLVEQLGVRVQRQYKQEYLADLMTIDTIYGVKQLRSTGVVPFVVPST